MLRSLVMALALSGCALTTQEVRPLPAQHRTPPRRTVRVIGTQDDMLRAGQQYCGDQYLLEFTSWDKTEGLVTCDH